jgi:hypothetical protein
MKRILAGAGFLALAAIVAGALASFSPSPSPDPQPPTASESLAELFPVQVNPGPCTPRVATGQLDFKGTPITVSCSSCHSTREPNREIRAAEQLNEFHRGLHFAHGSLSCLSCHHSDDYDSLRLADGSSIGYAEATRLCTQCHNRQGRDFERGLHGGMTGFWDRTRGPRQRHSCLDCHDAHQPAFPEMAPVFPPRDRFAPAAHDPHP